MYKVILVLALVFCALHVEGKKHHEDGKPHAKPRLFLGAIKNLRKFKAENDRPPVLHMMTCLIASIAVAIMVRTIINTFYIPVSSKLVLFCIGLGFGFFERYTGILFDYVEVIYTIPAHVTLSAMLPIVVFKVAFCIDAHAFVRAWLQIFFISIPGLFIMITFVGLMAMTILNAQWNWTYGMALVFGTVAAPTYPDEVMKLLKEIETSKQLGILVEGESVIGMGCVVVIFTILLGHVQGHIITWYHFIMVFIRFFGGGILAGYLTGKLACGVVSVLYNDALSMMSVTIIATCMSFYICQDIFAVSGVICVVVIGIMLSIERSSLSPEVEQLLVTNWELLAYIVDAAMFLMVGLITAEIFAAEATIGDYALMLVTYVVVMSGRFLAFICLAPILSRVGYGMTFRNMTVAVWGGIKGCVSICLTLIVYTHPRFKDMSEDLIIQIIGLVLLSLLINSSSMHMMLKLLGYFDLSTARKTNMNNCVKHVLVRRERTISMLKMDRFLADANWPTVNEATMIRHPYRISLKNSDDEDDLFVGHRYTVCPDCQKEIAAEPSAKELIEMTREAKMRILKAMKISYARQFEDGMISKDGFRILTQAVEIAMETNEAMVDLEGLHKLFRGQKIRHYMKRRLQKMFFAKHDRIIKPPRKKGRRVCYHIVMNRAFEPILYVVILLNFVPIIIEMSLKPATRSFLNHVLVIVNGIFFLIYLLEFILKIMAYSYIYVCSDGFRIYFSSGWNIFDFIILVTTATDFTLDIVDLLPNTAFDKSRSMVGNITMIARLMRVFRMVRLIRMARSYYPSLIKTIDEKIDAKVAYAYDIAKGFVTGEIEVVNKLTQMIDNKAIRDMMRERMEADRMSIMKELGEVQKERPHVPIMVKTKQATMAVLTGMGEAVFELKVSGWVDDVEYLKLMESLNSRFKMVRLIKSMENCEPQVLFKEVPWMGSEDDTISFLYSNSRTRTFEKGEIVCTEGKMSEGVYIITSGLLTMVYTPEPCYLEKISKYGVLPVIDYISSTRFESRMEDYIVSGNSIGELSVLTGRPYCCIAVAEIPTQVYVLSHEVIKAAIERSPDPTQGLLARMWKCVTMRMATSLLMDVPAYLSLKQERIRFTLERAFIPDLTRFKVFAVNDMMEDIILAEGIVTDYNTRDTYIAPTYIPRTVQKITMVNMTLPETELVIIPKLVIIPIQGADDYEVIELAEEMSEMISNPSLRNMQLINQQRARRKKKMRKHMMNKRKMGGVASTASVLQQRKSMMISSYEYLDSSMDVSTIRSTNSE